MKRPRDIESLGSGLWISRRAVQVNSAIVRAFVRLQELLLTNAVLATEPADLERKYDSQFKAGFDAIRQLTTPPPPPPKPEIGFQVKEDVVPYRIKRKRLPNSSFAAFRFQLSAFSFSPVPPRRAQFQFQSPV